MDDPNVILRRGGSIECANQAELDAVVAKLDGGVSVHLLILHDDRCNPQKKGGCKCKPEFVIEPLTTTTVMRGAAGQRRWLEDLAKRDKTS